MAQLDDNSLIPVRQKSEEDMEEDAQDAIAYLKRTNNLDLAEVIGLSTYLEEADEQVEDEEEAVPGGTGGNERSDGVHDPGVGRRLAEAAERDE